jgi:uracil-DNA glycosylase family protein
MATRRNVTRSAADHLPEKRTLSSLREAALGCKGCDLWKRGTQTVFGAWGPAPPGVRERRNGPGTKPGRARVIFVGEQPGNDEDLAGRPFVGPAGRLLDRALADAGIDRAGVYVTNVVKHFKWVERGKRRIHEKPSSSEISACLPWLTAEISVIRPRVIVCLGATAAQALLGKQFRVSRQRGEFIESPLGPRVLATVHPSSLLRAPDEETRRAETRRFIADLEKVARVLSEDR